MNPQDQARYRAKAATAAYAWQQVLGEAPTRHALILALAVADLETGLGSNSAHNWGFVHRRSLTAEEASILLGHGVFATDAASLPVARGLLTAGPNEQLARDTGPVGPYFVWWWAFANDSEAAAKFLEVLVRTRPTVRAIIDTATPGDLAAAMYATKYFQGTSTDPETNVSGYAAAIAKHAATIEAALTGWPPEAPSASQPLPPRTPSRAPTRASTWGWWVATAAVVGAGYVYLSRQP